MNRRTFFTAAAAFAAGAAFDYERLLWVRGQKLISIPAPRLLSVEELVDAAMLRLGYSRPLQPDQMTDTFLLMTDMFDLRRFKAAPWPSSIQIAPDSMACRAYVDFCCAVRDATQSNQN